MVYFICYDNRFIKIGFTTDLPARIAQLQTACPKKIRVKATLPGGYQTEAGLHQMFAKLRKEGEWFRITDEITWFLIAIQRNPAITNILELQKLSLGYRLVHKSRRLGKSHKLSQRIAKHST